MPRQKLSKPAPAASPPVDQPPETPAKPAALSVDDIENVGRAAAGLPPAPKPWASDPVMNKGMGEVIETIFPEGAIDSINGEYDELEKGLELAGALTPNAIRDALNGCEKKALRASRVHLMAKIDLARFERECEVAIGAMRENAAAELEAEKVAGTRSKAPTINDITDRAATKFPDEWRDINSSLSRSKRTVDQLERFAKLWEGRRFTLAAMAGARTQG